MKGFIVLALAFACTVLLVETTQAFHDDHGKKDPHFEELQEMLANRMMPELEDFPRFRRWAEEDSDNQNGQQGGGQQGGGGGGGRGRNGQKGQGGRGPPGQQNNGGQ